MRICHVSPHLPPDQAANALLPAQLGAWARASGDEVSFVAHAAGAGPRGDGRLGRTGASGASPRLEVAGLTRLLQLDTLRDARAIDARSTAARATPTCSTCTATA